MTTTPTNLAGRALVYKNDLIYAVNRVAGAWNTVQIEDALRSAEFFIKEMRLAMKSGKP